MSATPDPTIGSTNWGTQLNARLDYIAGLATSAGYNLVSPKVAGYSATSFDEAGFDTTTAPITQILPAAIAGNAWRAAVFAGTHTLTIAPAGSDVIFDTSPTSLTSGAAVINPGESLDFRCYTTGVWSRI